VPSDVFPRDEFYMNQDAVTTATFADRIAPAMALRRAAPAR
jgi:hypothetical protein